MKKWEIKELESGLLQVSDIHKIKYSTFGNRNGIPIVNFHGGPGGHSAKQNAAFIDQSKFFVITFDQRGCRESNLGELRENTTADLIEDTKKLLDFLGVKKSLFVGSSWGATLAMIFAEKFPEMNLGLIMKSVFFGGARWNEWVLKIARRILPQEYDNFMNVIQTTNPDELFDKFQNSDYKKKVEMSLAVDNWLWVLNKGLDRPVEIDASHVKPENIELMKIFLHYMKNNFFLKDGEIIKNSKALLNKMAIMCHGEFDFDCTLDEAWDFHKALPGSELYIERFGGHGRSVGGELYYKSINTFVG